MNDPHVVSLTYRIGNAETVDFDKAPPLAADRGAFRVTLDAYKAIVEMVDHFASVEEARNAVEPFLRAWELELDLLDSGDLFRFVYETAQVVDRNRPAAGDAVIAVGVGGLVVSGDSVVAHASRGKWPDPPQDIVVSPDADVLWRRRRRYREKQEKLLAAAYWALTILEAAPGLAAPLKPRRSSKRRQAASAFFNIDLEVPLTMRDLPKVAP